MLTITGDITNGYVGPVVFNGQTGYLRAVSIDSNADYVSIAQFHMHLEMIFQRLPPDTLPSSETAITSSLKS